ncbi:MAG: transcriptional regulator [Hymenobacter sp.]|nr:MAG: transcriptional regulator [Hymenobacter sp.]
MTEEQLLSKLHEFINLGAENEIVEFKEAKSDYHFEKIGKYFSALSNEANLNNQSESWLIFGVRDKPRQIIGSSYRVNNRASLDKLKSEVAQKSSNHITFIEIHELNTAQGRVIMFQIPAAPQGIPVSWSGHYYGRDGEELVPLNIEEIERIRRQATFIDWSSEICAGATVADLDEIAILKARENFKKKNTNLTLEVDQWDDITFLNKSKLTINGGITRSAIILLGKSESEHFIKPALARIAWILKDKDNIERDYYHFTCPLIINVNEVFIRIRNIKYRYIKDDTLFPEEVDQYEPYVIREALHNCIAHQDYTLNGRINVVEREDGQLIFTNMGAFIPGSIEKVIHQDAPPEQYRNPYLAQAMVNLNMIDTVGSGIKRMFITQKNRYFPLPDYDFSDKKVKVTITGKVIDNDYSIILAQNRNLNLDDIIVLDKIQKKKHITKQQASALKAKGLVEGRYPAIHISAKVAQATGQTVGYMQDRGIDGDFIKKSIEDYLKKFHTAEREIFEGIILNKISDSLTMKQKKDRIKNVLQAMRREGTIKVKDKVWSLK